METGGFMNEQAMQEALERSRAERRAAASARQLSDAVRDTPFGRLLAKAGGMDYSEELRGFNQDQWETYEASQELVAQRPNKREREEDASAYSCAPEE
jgi:hypothetical protein